MLDNLAFFFGQGQWWTPILYFALFFLFIFIYPKMMMKSLIQKLERTAVKFEEMSEETREYMSNELKNDSELSKTEIREKVDNIVDMFTVMPEDTDPSGVMKKIKYMYDIHDNRYRDFISRVSDIEDDTVKSYAAATVHTTGVNTIAKTVRHMVELMKELKNIQIGMILKMQLPMIEKQIKMLKDSVESFVEEEPVGDSIGPLCAASLMKDSEPEEIAEDHVCAEVEIEGRDVFVLKPNGPAAVLGEVHDAIETICENNDIDKIIPIDAKGKMKGEERGKVVEGIGFAMGPRGNAERHWIEDIAVEDDITIESIGIEQDPMEDTVRPMKEEIYEAVPEVRKKVKESIMRTPEDAKVIIAGIGISVGVGNTEEELEVTREKIEENIEKMEQEEEEEDDEPLGEKIADALTPY